MLTAAPTPMQGKLKALRPSGSPAAASPWGVSQDVVVSPSTRASTVLVTDIPADVLMPRDGVARSPAGKAKRVLDGRYVSVRDSQVLNTFSTLSAEYGTVLSVTVWKPGLLATTAAAGASTIPYEPSGGFARSPVKLPQLDLEDASAKMADAACSFSLVTFTEAAAVEELIKCGEHAVQVLISGEPENQGPPRIHSLVVVPMEEGAVSEEVVNDHFTLEPFVPPMDLGADS